MQDKIMTKFKCHVLTDHSLSSLFLPRIAKSCLQACLKITRSSCDPRGVRAAVGVLSDLLQFPRDYKIPLLDLGHSCLTELLLLL